MRFGTGAWCGYSFSWMAALRARVGDAEAALRNLDIYTRAFILRNGFHANGDQTKSGFSGLPTGRSRWKETSSPLAAVHEMLLQSWSAAPGSGDWGMHPHLSGHALALARGRPLMICVPKAATASPPGARIMPRPGSASWPAATA